MWAKLLAGVVEAFNLVMTFLGRERDRQAGRDEQKAADLAKTTQILEGQRDEAAKPLPAAGDLLERMRRQGDPRT